MKLKDNNKFLNLIKYIIVTLGLTLIIIYIYKNLGNTTNLIESFQNNSTLLSTESDNILLTDTEYINIQKLIKNNKHYSNNLFSGYSEILDFIITKNLIKYLNDKQSLANLSKDQHEFLKTIKFEDVPRIYISYSKYNNKLKLYFHPRYYKKSQALIKLNKNKVTKHINQYPRIPIHNIDKTKRLEALLTVHKIFNKVSIINDYTELIGMFILKNKSNNITSNILLNYDETSNYGITNINNKEDLSLFEDGEYNLEDLLGYYENMTKWQPYIILDNNYEKINNNFGKSSMTFSSLLDKKFEFITNANAKSNNDNINSKTNNFLNLDKSICDYSAISFLLNNNQLNVSIEPERITNFTSTLLEPNTLSISFRLKSSNIADGISYDQLINICKSKLIHSSKNKTLTYYVLKNNLQILKVIWNY